MQKSGRKLSSQYVVEGGTGDEGGYRAMTELLRLKRPPDGVVCYNDPVAAARPSRRFWRVAPKFHTT